MNYKHTRVTYGTTGIKTITCGFQPLGYRVTVTPASGASSTYMRQSVGVCDTTNQTCDQITQSHDRGRQERFTNRVADIRDWNGASWVQKVQTDHDSVTATELKLNAVVADSAYQHSIEIWG